jgi:hypothetical protein
MVAWVFDWAPWLHTASHALRSAESASAFDPTSFVKHINGTRSDEVGIPIDPHPHVFGKAQEVGTGGIRHLVIKKWSVRGRPD